MKGEVLVFQKSGAWESMPTCGLQVKVSKIVGRVQAGYSNHKLHFIDNDDKMNMPPM